MTVVHNVLFKLKSKTDAPQTAKVLRGMSGKIPELLSIEVGINQLDTPRSYDLALITKFETWEALEVYRKHPVHQPVLAHMAEVTETAAVVDYEE